MKKMFTVTALTATLMCAVALAQSATPSAADPAQALRIAPGTVIPVELTKTIDAKKAKTGDEVFAKVSRDLKTNSGEILVSKDTKVIGHVTEAKAHSKEQKESEIGIAFDHAVSKAGEMQLPMSIRAIVAPPSDASADSSAGGYGRSGPATGGATATSPMGNRNGPMEGTPPPPSPTAVPTSGDSAQRPPITGNTQGVIGMPDLRLAPSSQNATQGSVVTSEKGNVKLESGTILLLRVNP